MIDWLTVNWPQLFWGIGAFGFTLIWRRTGLILDELRLLRAERRKGAPLTEEETEHVLTASDVLLFQPPDKNA